MDGTDPKIYVKTNEANCELIAEFVFLTGLLLTANKFVVNDLDLTSKLYRFILYRIFDSLVGVFPKFCLLTNF